MERIDKITAVCLAISRKDAAKLIKNGEVSVDGITPKSPKEKFDENDCEIACGGKKYRYKKHVYIMLNKPKGCICATDGKGEKTVLDLLPAEIRRNGLFPAGRLDKDTTGFALITDDGEFAHKILSPKNHIAKTYIAALDKPFDDELQAEFEKGVTLSDAQCMPARIEPLNGERTLAEVEIKQGMYHQIKRMFAAFGITVTDLKRIKMGSLELDGALGEGEFRFITSDELEKITDYNP